MTNSWEAYLVDVSVAILAGWVLAWLGLRRWGRTVRNFQGKPVPVGYGVYLWWAALAGSAGAYGAWGLDHPGASVGCAVVVGAFGILGIIDDHWGTHGAGGFLGHFRAIVVERRVTTGALKAVGGGLVALVGAWMLRPGAYPLQSVADAALIALSANFINLLDLRPGRAAWVFLVLWAGILGAGDSLAYLLWTVPAGLSLTFLLAPDSRGGWMMGDAGSNVLGALLGIGIVFQFDPAVRLAALGVLVVVHIYAEKHSISKVIEGSRVLSAIDRRLGVR